MARIIIFLDGSGYARARYTSGSLDHDTWAKEKYNLATMGFKQVDSINIPDRLFTKYHGMNILRDNRGWVHYYHDWLCWAIHALGI